MTSKCVIGSSISGRHQKTQDRRVSIVSSLSQVRLQTHEKLELPDQLLNNVSFRERHGPANGGVYFSFVVDSEKLHDGGVEIFYADGALRLLLGSLGVGGT